MGQLLAHRRDMGEMCAIRFARGSRVIIAVCRSGALRTLDALSLEPKATVRLAVSGVRAFAMDAAGEHALIATDARSVVLLTNQLVHVRDVERAMQHMLVEL